MFSVMLKSKTTGSRRNVMKKLACLLSLVIGAALVTLSLSGCSERANGPAALGGAQVKTYVQLPPGGNYTVTVTITGDGITDPIVVPLTQVGNQWVANLNDIPAGTNRTFTLSVLDASGTVIYSGVATGVTITSGQTASVSIGGQQTNAPPATGNSSPVIDALIASSITVSAGATVSLSVTAHDPDAGDTLSYLWTSDSGTFDSANTSATNWTAPETDGTYRITVQVQDNHGAQATMSVDITVSTPSDAGSEAGTATISVTLNNWPVVSGVTSTKGRIDVGDTTALDCTASDADGDPLTYAWSTDSGCAGTFSASNIKSPTFTLGATLPASGTCAFTVTVSDGRGGTGTGSLTITAAPAPPVLVSPQIVSSSQSAQSAVAGQTVTLSVLATDPQNTAMTFAWSAARGTLGTPIDLGAGSEQVVWTAPLNFVEAIQVQVTITDAGNASTVQSFTIAKTAPPPPSGDVAWTSAPDFYGAGDGCDCGQGLWDPDCAISGQRLYNCNNGEACVQSGQTGICQTVMTPSMPDPAPPSTAPAGWTCDPTFYNAEDGCDCGCGAFDPDCGKPDQELYNCNQGQYCGQSGTCESLPSH
jgi:PKD domain